MGLRCLLGHDFASPEVERERREDGNEVVVTVREVKTCQRCGREVVVSENKEVTAVASPSEGESTADTPAGFPVEASDPGTGSDSTPRSDVGVDRVPGPDREPERGPDPEASTPAEAAPDAAEAGVDADADAGPEPEADDAEIIDDGDGERGHGEWPAAPDVESVPSDGTATGGAPDAGEASAAPDAPGAAVDAEPESESESEPEGTPDDDAEFIDAESGSGRVPWPEHDDRRAVDGAGAPGGGDEAGDASAAWPSADGDDEGFDAAARSAGGPGVAFGGGLGPDGAEGGSGAAGNGAAEFVGHDRDAPETDGLVRAENVETGSARPERAEFYCPSCGHAERAGGTSMRPGDVCPECHKGYIAQREA
jgi:hypothetical protein